MSKSIKLKNNVYLDAESVKNGMKLIARNELTSQSSTLELTGLNLQKGKSYILEISEYSTTNSSAGHYIRINDISNNYGTHWYFGTGYGFTCSNHGSGVGFANGWNMNASLFHTTGTISYFNADWVGWNGQSVSVNSTDNKVISVLHSGCANMKAITTINKISVITSDGDTIGVGSYIELYGI